MASSPLLFFQPPPSLARRPTASPGLGKPRAVTRRLIPRSTAADESPDSPKPARRGRKKSAETATSEEAEKPKASRGRASKKSTPKPEQKAENVDDEGFDDEMDIPYEWPPLVCCFGVAQCDFVPVVRPSVRQSHPDRYSSWKELQWEPPEFARAPGGPASNVAIAHVRLGGRAAFIGKVNADDLGLELLHKLNLEKVQTRGVKIEEEEDVKTATAYMRLQFHDGGDGRGERLKAETVKNCAEDLLRESEINLAVLKEARMLHFNAGALLTPEMRQSLFRSIALTKKFGGKVFFDPNLPLTMWRSGEATWEMVQAAWREAEVIEVSTHELDFLLDEERYARRRNNLPQYYVNSAEETRWRYDYYHYAAEEVAPLWHDKLKLLLVTQGTMRLHYYTPAFHGVVVGTEDVLVAQDTCDRTGSGDAVVAAVMRKLTTCPEMYEDKDVLERQLRFAVAAGIIAQWTIGAARGLPTESAAQNLKEQVYVPSMW